MKRFFCLIVLSVMCFICSGCFQARTDLTISEDGNVNNYIAFCGVDLLKKQIDDLKDSLVQSMPSANVTSIDSDNMSGYRIEATYPNIEEFANSGMKFYLSKPGKCKGIQQHKGIFFDEYYFDLFIEKNSSEQQTDNEMENAFLSQVQFEFNINLPYAAESHNADTSLNENKSLSWNLRSILVGNEDRQLQFRFKIWHKLNCIIAVAIILLFLIATLFFILQTKKISEGNELSSAMTKIKIFGISTVVLIAATAYMLFAPTEFTDDDIISRIATNEYSTAEENKNSSLENKNDTIPVEKPQPITRKQEKNVSSALNAQDLSLGNLTIHDREDEVQSIFGNPISSSNDNNSRRLKFKDIEVVLRQGKVSALVSLSSAVTTPRGIHEGSSIQEVFDKYGTNYKESSYGDETLYEYVIQSSEGRSCYLRFAGNNSNGKVAYISVRFVQ